MSVFRYPGGKQKLSSTIISKLSTWDLSKLQYREPFFGGGSIGIQLLQKRKISSIWINDKDTGIACLWTCIIRYCDDFKRGILSYRPRVEDFYSMREELLGLKYMPRSKNDILDMGLKKLIIHQISYSGLGTKSGGPLGGKLQKSRYPIDCRWSPEYICKKIQSISLSLFHARIHDTRCTNEDFVDLIIDSTYPSVLYLDPPYYLQGNSLYQCGFSIEDHERLSKYLQYTKHKWVLSYDDCPEIRKLYGWAKIDVLKTKYTITTTDTPKQELLICGR